MRVARKSVGTLVENARMRGWLLMVNRIFERGKQIMEQDLICKKCKRFIGKLDADGVVLTIGESLFFNEVRFSHLCGRVFKFKPVEPRDLTSIKGYTQEILINLGKTKKVRGY